MTVMRPLSSPLPTDTRPLATLNAGVEMTVPKVGDRISDLAFILPDRTSVHLSDFGGALLLVFLRHLH